MKNLLQKTLLPRNSSHIVSDSLAPGIIKVTASGERASDAACLLACCSQLYTTVSRQSVKLDGLQLSPCQRPHSTDLQPALLTQLFGNYDKDTISVTHVCNVS